MQELPALFPLSSNGENIISVLLTLKWKVSLAGRQVELIGLRVWEREAETEMELYMVGKG